VDYSIAPRNLYLVALTARSSAGNEVAGKETLVLSRGREIEKDDDSVKKKQRAHVQIVRTYDRSFAGAQRIPRDRAIELAGWDIDTTAAGIPRV